MKKILKKMLIFLAAFVFTVGMSVTVFADGNVTYEGNAKSFIFEPGSEYSPTDLFSDFKNLMPGESVTQKVTVKNAAENKVKVKIYMRSLGAKEGSEEFLSQLNLTVKQDGDSELFDAAASETAQLTDWVCLGTLYSGGEVDLDVTVDVPAEVGNEFQETVGYLDWQFKVEEFPIENSDPLKPKTGDDFNAWIWVIAAGAAAAAIAGAMRMKRAK